MEVIYLVCGARRPQLKRDPLGSYPPVPNLFRFPMASCANERL